MELLLVSNSTQHGGGYLEHCAEEVETLLEGVRELLFVPFALHDHDAYTAIVRKRFSPGREVVGLHEPADPVAAVEEAEAIFIGGGNTFRLLKGLYDRQLIEPIRRRVSAGMPYLGTSAGTNVATCTIKTTNDMPIVQPPSFDALSLVPFQINPHFIDADYFNRHEDKATYSKLHKYECGSAKQGAAPELCYAS